jgi:hypothetical protein
MDCGTAGAAAGIDPKILDNWQSDTAFSIASWEHAGYDQQFEWDTSPDSNQDEADVVDLGVLHGSLANDQPSASVFGHNPDPRLAQSPIQSAMVAIEVADGSLKCLQQPRSHLAREIQRRGCRDRRHHQRDREPQNLALFD